MPRRPSSLVSTNRRRRLSLRRGARDIAHRSEAPDPPSKSARLDTRPRKSLALFGRLARLFVT